MIVKMKKLNVLGLKSEKKKVLDVLRGTGYFELSGIENIMDELKTVASSFDSKNYEQSQRNLFVLEQAISWMDKASVLLKEELKRNKKEKVVLNFSLKGIAKKSMFFYRKEVKAADINEAGERGQDIINFAQSIIEANERIDVINKTLEENKAEIIRLLPYKNVDARLCDIGDSKHLFMLLGLLSKSDIQKVKKEFSAKEGYSLQFFDADKKTCVTFLSGPITTKFEALNILSSFKFEQQQFNYAFTAKDAVENLKQQNQDLLKEKFEILLSASNDASGISDLKLFYDYLMLEIEAMDAQKNIGETKKTFFIEGWVPAENAKEIIDKIKKISNSVECEVIEAERGVEPPTLTRNNALISPFEAVTNMYSPPSPFERDPNPFVAIFFFVFFGIMIGDAIYGIALFALTFILLRCYKMETGFRKLMMILCLGGISAFIWGAVYNSWAAVGLPYNPIINPVEHPFDFLILMLGFGYLQIMFGFILKFIANLRAKDFVSCLADSGWKLLIMLGGALNIPSLLSYFENQFTIISLPSMPSAVIYTGLIMIAIGLIGMLITGGRHKSNISGKIISGVGSWYDLVGLLSDILSYCRLFGLALSGAIIGSVANILATDVLFNIPVLGYVLGLAVAIFFHIFNLALACLGAYVHNSRLQFVEFFGKFYDGGGRSFMPLGHCTKYTVIKQ